MSLPGPLVSVIIPAYYSAPTIPACLDALRRQTFRTFEVIMVNSSPEGETEALVRSRYPEIRFEQNRGRMLPHEARNRGAALARGDLFVFTDPDCEADPGWLERLVAACREDCQALVGAMELGGDGLWEQAVHLVKFHWLLPGLAPGTKFCAPTANAAYTRRLWERIGPFPDGYYAGDGVLSYRAALAGHPPQFVPSALVRHRHLDSPAGLALQRFHRGRDYARAQLCEMREAGWAAWLRLTFSWAALPLVLARAQRDASRCGWVRPYLLTFPVQLAGHGLWELGESWGALETLVRRLHPAGVK